MKLILDNIIFSLQKSGGISVVWYELISSLYKDEKFDLKFIEYGVNHNLFRKQILINQQDILNKPTKFSIFTRYINPTIIENDFFLFHSSYYRISTNKNAINITTVHDFTYELYRHGIKKYVHCKQKYSAIRKSDFIICVSENTKNDLLKYLPDIDSNKIYVVYNGVSDSYFPLKTENTFKPCFDKNKYIIFIGLRDEYKHFDIAVKTAAKLKTNLIIIGGKKLKYKEIKFLKSELTENNYFQYEKVTNEELNIIYNNALCLLYPSEYEGFGIPVIEAQKAGCPVIAFNCASVKEIVGNSAVLFDNFDAIEIANYINSKLTLESTREKIINEGINNSLKFSWRKTYLKTLEVYKTASEMRKKL